MITKDEITMYICSYALFLKDTYDCKCSTSDEQFWDIFLWQDFFPDSSLTVNTNPDISLTCLKFPDISRFSRQVFHPDYYCHYYLTTSTHHTMDLVRPTQHRYVTRRTCSNKVDLLSKRVLDLVFVTDIETSEHCKQHKHSQSVFISISTAVSTDMCWAREQFVNKNDNFKK